jgi:hypothetical protein
LEIDKVYAAEEKSSLRLEGREQLKALLHDVEVWATPIPMS